MELYAVALRRLPGQPLFKDNAERVDFMRRAQVLSQRWKLSLWGFRLFSNSAHFVVAGSEIQVAQLQRLLQSGHGVWRRHRGDFLCWAPSERWRLGEEKEGLQEVDRIHALGHGGLNAPWSSLRDYLGLRQSSWFDFPVELAAVRSEEDWLSALQCRPVCPPKVFWRSPGLLAAPLIGEALVQATGQLPTARKNSLLWSASLWHAGWTIGEISEQRNIGSAAVKSAIRNCDVELLKLVLRHLQDERLFASLQAVDGPLTTC